MKYDKKWVIAVFIGILSASGITLPEIQKEKDSGDSQQKMAEKVILDSNIYVLCPIKPDSIRDLTLQFKIFFDTLQSGTENRRVILSFYPGKYLIDGDSAFNSIRDKDGKLRGAYGAIEIKGKKYLTINGEGATFVSNAPAVPYNSTISGNGYSRRRHIFLTESNNIALLNITLKGSNYTRGDSLKNGQPIFWHGKADRQGRSGAPGYRAAWEFEHGIAVHGCDSITIDNANISAVWGDAVYLGNYPSAPTTRAIVRNSYFEKIGRQGVALCNTDSTLIENITLRFGRRSAIDFEPYNSEGFVRNVVVRNCDLKTQLTVIASAGNGDVSGVKIIGNKYHTTGHFISCFDSREITRRSNWLVENNERLNSFGSPSAPIRFGMTDGIVIRNNIETISEKQSRTIAYFSDCTGIVIEGNDFGSGNHYFLNGEKMSL